MLEALLVNLLATALWEAVLEPSYRGIRTRKELSSYDAVIKQATAEIVAFAKTERATRSAERFLSRPEVRGIVRQIYYTRAGKAGVPLGELRTSFASLWAHHSGDRVRSMDAYGLFDALVDACEQVLDKAVRGGVLAAHEAKSASRQNVVLDQLDAIHRQVLLLSADEPDLGLIDAFERKLTKAVAADCSEIVPPSLEGAQPVPIDDLYVAPSFLSGEDSLDYHGLLERINRLVLLGDPGAGKSTFGRKLCHDLATGKRKIAGDSTPTPVFVVLRRYTAEKAERPCSVVEYLHLLARTTLQLNVPPHAFEYLLLAGRLLIVFDGLDELPVLNRRREVRGDILHFAREFPNAPIVVTSRRVGYEHAPLDPERFDLARLSHFDDRQIGQYASKWFALDRRLNPQEQGLKRDAFLRESTGVRDLRRNALMLGLMCTLYRGQGYLPRNRPEVYDKCATMLFEAWDKHRGIEFVLPIEEHLRPAMRDLARWIYERPELQNGVPEHMLVAQASSFLNEHRFGDEHRAHRAATQFVEFCRGRAWVFSDSGLDEHDEPLFSFTHRTFLEFFTAEELVGRSETVEELAGELIPHVAAGEWEVVAQLALQIRSRRQTGAADRFIAACLRSLEVVTPDERENLFEFLAGALAVVVPRPATTASVVVAALSDAPTTPDALAEGRSALNHRLQLLLAANPENLDVITETVRATAVDWLERPDREFVDAAWELGLEGAQLAENVGLWHSAMRELRQSQRAWWNRSRPDDLGMALDAVAAKWIPLEEVLRTRSIDVVFSSATRRHFPTPQQASLLERTLNGDDHFRPQDFEALTTWLVAQQPPWTDDKSLTASLHTLFPDDHFSTSVDWPKRSESRLLPTILLVAMICERPLDRPKRKSGHPFESRLLGSLRRRPANDPLSAVILQRSNDAEPEDAEDVLREMSGSHAAVALLRRWWAGELDLVQPEPTAGPGKPRTEVP